MPSRTILAVDVNEEEKTKILKILRISAFLLRKRSIRLACTATTARDTETLRDAIKLGFHLP